MFPPFEWLSPFWLRPSAEPFAPWICPTTQGCRAYGHVGPPSRDGRRLRPDPEWCRQSRHPSIFKFIFLELMQCPKYYLAKQSHLGVALLGLDGHHCPPRHEKFHSFAKDLAAFTVKLEQYSISVQVKHTLQNLTKITTTLQFLSVLHFIKQ